MTNTGAPDLETLARRLTAAFEASDWGAMVALYEPDGEILSAGRPRIAGRTTIESLLRAFPPAHLRRSRQAITDVQQSGDPAVERLSRVALLCRRREGSWHIWRDVDGPSPDAARMRELLG